MKDRLGYVRASRVFLPCGEPTTAAAEDTRINSLGGKFPPLDEETPDEDALGLRALVRVLRFEIAPALWEIARAVRIAEALDAPPFSPCAAPRRSRKGKAARS